MPEITAHGDPFRAPGKWPYRAEWHCPQCGCRWRLAPTDQAQITYDQREGDYATYHCPECRYPATLSRVAAMGQAMPSTR